MSEGLEIGNWKNIYVSQIDSSFCCSWRSGLEMVSALGYSIC